MPGISVHAVDVARGVPAQGMAISIHALAPRRVLLAQARIGPSGGLDHAITTQRLPAGPYEVSFHVGAYFASVDVALPDPPFLDEVPFRFSIADPDQHIHLPLKLTPWGYSLFRGS